MNRTITTKQTIYYGDGSAQHPQTIVRETTYSQRTDGVTATLDSGVSSGSANPKNIGWNTPPITSASASLAHSSPFGNIKPMSAGSLQASNESSNNQGPILLQAANTVSKTPSLFVQTKSYEQIKNETSGGLFEDPDFPAVTSSVYSRQPIGRQFVWKRPHEISKNPVFISDGVSRFDVVQGELGDCWLLASVANVTLHPELAQKVIPPGQTFEKPGYCGAFRFNFWYYGKWREVVVDDRLPTYNNRLIFMHSADNNEFWSALLEKAYAKLVGSYENLKGGSTCEAMTDFTGGFCETFELRAKAPKNLLQIMLKAFERKSLMGCSINQQGGMATESKLANGLIMGHAYSVTAIKLIAMKSMSSAGKMPLVRIRNPWGSEAEWRGAWSDNSREWNLLSDTERRELGITFDADGEFWMSFQDFITNFESLEICHVSLDTVGDDISATKNNFRWESTLIEGEWRRRVNAGGCRNYLQTFWTNPQYRISIQDPDANDEENMCTILIGLLQKDRRKQRSQGFDYLTIGFSLYQLKDPNCGPLDHTFFERNASIARTTFINLREVSGRFKVPPGHYVVVPSTFEPGIDGEFVTRIYTETPNKSGEIDDKTAISPPTISLPPPTVQEKTMLDEAGRLFRQVSGEDAEVDAHELMQILNATFAKDLKFSGFTIETARSLVALRDKDMSGKLGRAEFDELWEELRLFKKTFLDHDKDRSGHLQSIELRQALQSCGFRLNNQTLKALIMRYADKQGNLDFDDFICCAIRMKAMISKFQSFAGGRKEALIASLTLDDFILTTMYC